MPVRPTLQGVAIGMALVAGLAPVVSFAQPRPSVADRFQIGNDPLVLCSAQLDRRDTVASGMFDRGYALVCRDARLPVGQLYVLRADGDDPEPRLAAARAARMACAAPQPAVVGELGDVRVRTCRSTEDEIEFVVYEARRGRRLYVVQGLKGYDAALQLSLRTIVLDRQVPGQVPVGTAGAEDPAAFARAVAGTLDPASTRQQGYRSNFSGDYLEAAEYFGGVQSRIAGTGISADELSLNLALQQSNLGNIAAADRLFAESADVTGDPLLGRLRRNYLALHLLNQGRTDEAIAEARRDLGGEAGLAEANAAIDDGTARRLNSDSPMAQSFGRQDPPPLSRAERIAILDAQAAHVSGAALRLKGRGAEARQVLTPALQAVAAIREGHVASVYWLRAQILIELAEVAESEGNPALAQGHLRDAARLMATEYPGTYSEYTTRLKLAGLLARQGNGVEARELFRGTIRDAVATGETNALRFGLGPYFTLLEQQSASDPAIVDEYFFASQTLVQLGVARSQFEFARILSSGGDEAAALFRASSQISREINRLRLELARSADPQGGAQPRAPGEIESAIAELEAQQTATQALLNKSARYQVTSSRPLALGELQSVLGPEEVYYKVFFVGGQAHGLVATGKSARIVPIAASEADVTRSVGKIRDSIRKEIGGQTYVLAFDVETAYALGQTLIAPIAAELKPGSQLLFEPDGALLSLPLTLLVTERGGVDSYLQRAQDPAGDPYDMRGVAWLGRDVAVSTTVSPRALHLLRTSRPPSAPRPYLGMGDNAPAPRVQRAVLAPGGDAICALPGYAWDQPIPATELVAAQEKVGANSQVVTGAAFSDTALRARQDLDQFRILHFATHGLITPPSQECQPQPALMTSWGGEDSDGLLTFQEVFSLSINADVVILSACETAAGASQESTRLTTGELSGGGYALDGLVRAFVGAGARSVVASHWPVPEKPIDATTELISYLFDARPGQPLARQLQELQRRMMDRAQTSHPYYWASFAIIGDGATPLVPNN